jgi:hypothetical protein
VELELAADADGTIARAARVAAHEAGIEPSPNGSRPASPWWRAGVEDARERTPAGVGRARYDAAPPRSTRGATRA